MCRRRPPVVAPLQAWAVDDGEEGVMLGHDLTLEDAAVFEC